MPGFARRPRTVLECRDPHALAEFYAAMTGMSVVYSDDDWVTLSTADDNATDRDQLSFQQAPDHASPTWPDPSSSMQTHLDFDVDDLDAAEEQVLRLGATKFAEQPGTGYRVYADPAGHPFCLCQGD